MKKRKQIGIIFLATVVLTLIVFVGEQIDRRQDMEVVRNSYGEGKRIEEYEVTIEGEKERIQLEIEEQSYTREEIQEMFDKLLQEMDALVLGENDSWDYVERDLNLFTQLEKYPVQIQWELSSYDVLSLNGKIREEQLVEEGTLVEIRGTISYGEEQVIYIRNARVYPPIREKEDKLLYEIRQKVTQLEESTRETSSFRLPKEVAGKSLEWSRQTESRWYYVLFVGVVLCVFLVYQEQDRKKQQEKKRKEAFTRAYPILISKFAMLLGTGTTIKTAWEKILCNKGDGGMVYEEMQTTLHEMQSGISEAEAYERFGKRCGLTAYMKFGALLSQNLRKGSKGLGDMLRMEAIEAFERRKSMARRLGEEAGSKLLAPMLGMLAVVLIMVMVPAFMTMQI